jgi:pyruvate formate lyase activating enzyme
MKKLNIWVEITTLIIPGQNDSKEELTNIAEFIAKLDNNIPWHISAFHPDFEFNELPPTPPETLNLAFRIAKEKGIKYVYLGNLHSDNKENTYCPSCEKILIKRNGFFIEDNLIKENKCPYCKEKIAGIGL